MMTSRLKSLTGLSEFAICKKCKLLFSSNSCSAKTVVPVFGKRENALRYGHRYRGYRQRIADKGGFIFEIGARLRQVRSFGLAPFNTLNLVALQPAQQERAHGRFRQTLPVLTASFHIIISIHDNHHKKNDY